VNNMNIIFYTFVVLGFIYHIYIVAAYFINRKRDQLIKLEEEKETKQKYNKCPHCGVLNPRSASTCQFCKKNLPAAMQPPESTNAGQKVSPGSGEENLPLECPEQAPPPAVRFLRKNTPALKKDDTKLDSFLFKNLLPMPNMTAIISFTSFYIMVIFVYSFLISVYTIGKVGVDQLNEVTKRQAEKQYRKRSPGIQKDLRVNISSSGNNAKNIMIKAPPVPEKTLPPVPVHTMTPEPSATPLNIHGTENEQITQLMLYLESENWNTALSAKKSIIKKGSPAVPHLIKEITHPDSMIRTHVITALGKIADPDSVPALRAALDHEDPVTVIQVISALSNIKADGVGEAITDMVHSKDWRIRRACAFAYGKIAADSSRADSFIAILENLKNDKSSKVRDAAENALKSLMKKE
jgi:HEAT repeat protein